MLCINRKFKLYMETGYIYSRLAIYTVKVNTPNEMYYTKIFLIARMKKKERLTFLIVCYELCI